MDAKVWDIICPICHAESESDGKFTKEFLESNHYQVENEKIQLVCSDCQLLYVRDL